MFDFSKIKMSLDDISDSMAGATDAQINELEQYCGHMLPENYKTILRKYNGCKPHANYFDLIDKETGVPLEWQISNFFYLNNDRTSPDNIWWIIENYADFLGPNTVPFADDGLQQIYYLKWVHNIPQVWFLACLDLDEPETYFVMESFDQLLEALYSTDQIQK